MRETEALKKKIDNAIKIVTARAKEEMRGNMSQEGNKGGDGYAEWLREVFAKLRHISLNLEKGMSQGEKENFGSCNEALRKSRKELKNLQDSTPTSLIANIKKTAHDSVIATINNIR